MTPTATATTAPAPVRRRAAGPGGNEASLLVQGEDRPGIIAAVASALAAEGANITALDQYADPATGIFFQRAVLTHPHLQAALPALREALDARLRGEMELPYLLRDLSVPKRVAIFASKSDHCLLDLLWRHRRGELPVSIAMVVSNHTDTAEEVRQFNIPFFHVPSTGPDKSAAEAEHLRLLRGNVDFVVLARYMQILSGEFIGGVGVPIINIHHSFLPSFAGARPYHQAYDRGVKLIGATCHYVTADLDEGPIIEQDTRRVDHGDSAEEMRRVGRDVERLVLARGLRWHLQDRILLNGTKTVVFP